MILVKWVIACLHARCSVMPQEVKIPGRNKKELSVRSFEINNTVLVPGKIVYKSRVFVNFNVSSVQPITLKLATAGNSRIGDRIGDQSMERPVSKLRV